MSRYSQGGTSKGTYSACGTHGYDTTPRLSSSLIHLLLGYYNPMLAYGEDKAILDAKAAGANGYIMVDLPPEEAITFREKCTNAGCVRKQFLRCIV